MDFFKRFHIVFNALDNVDARRHVNKMCIAADVAMVDSGTTGFNGHAQVIKKVREEDDKTQVVKKAPSDCLFIRVLPNATIASRRRRRRVTPFARSDPPLHSQYTA